MKEMVDVEAIPQKREFQLQYIRAVMRAQMAKCSVDDIRTSLSDLARAPMFSAANLASIIRPRIVLASLHADEQ
jgi:hypothetical protein